MVVARRTAQSTVFVSVIEPYVDQPTVTSARIIEPSDGVVTLAIERAGAVSLLSIAPDSRPRSVGETETSAAVCLISEGRTYEAPSLR